MARTENSQPTKESEAGLVSFWDMANDIINYASGLGIDPEKILYETVYIIGSGKRKGSYKLSTYRPENETAEFNRIGSALKLPWNSFRISVYEQLFSKCTLPEQINNR